MDKPDVNQARNKAKLSPRRRYLKLLGGGAFGISSLAFSEPIAASTEDTTQIVTLRSHEGPAETEFVPTEWLEREVDAREGSEILKERFQTQDDIVLVGKTLGDVSIQGHRVHNVKVGTRGKSTDVDIPDEVIGVPVEVVNNVSFVPEACYEANYNPVRGGVGVIAWYDSTRGVGEAGSACCAVYKSGNEYILTARHLFHDDNICDNPDTTGNIMDQWDEYFGDVGDQYKPHDTVVVPPTSGRNVSNDIVVESATIKGWVTQDGCDHFSSVEKVFKARVRKSCSFQAKIDSCGNNYNGCLTDFVALDDNYTQSGDSGGIVYLVDDDGDAWVLNMHSGTAGGSSIGPSAYAIKNEQGYTFGN